MKRLLPLLCLALAIPAFAQERLEFTDPSPAAGRACGTPSPQRHELLQVETARQHLMAERLATATGVIRVQFHVLHTRRIGNVSDEQVAAQIAELNRAFAGTGYSFELAAIHRTLNPAWFHMYILGGTEIHAKRALAVDPAHYLNLYTAGLGAQLLGWAYYPWSFPEDNYMHGVVVHYGSLPGGYLAPYDLGRTAVHEVGHYLGLLHTFENGCEEPGDLIADTPAEATPASRCPEGRDTCPSEGLDPIHNYMDYTDDACVTEFTPDQVEYMHSVVPAYRPSLFGSLRLAADTPEFSQAGDVTNPGDLSRVIEFRGAGPNPFHGETAVRFALPRAERVSLRVFDVAGRPVRTLIDAQLPAGAHSARFAAADLPAGLYFLSLRVGRTHMTRTALHLR